MPRVARYIAVFVSTKLNCVPPPGETEIYKNLAIDHVGRTNILKWLLYMKGLCDKTKLTLPLTVIYYTGNRRLQLQLNMFFVSFVKVFIHAMNTISHSLKIFSLPSYNKYHCNWIHFPSQLSIFPHLVSSFVRSLEPSLLILPLPSPSHPSLDGY